MTYDDYMSVCKRHYLESVLKEANGSVTEAARIDGRNRSGLYRLLWQAGLMEKTVQKRKSDVQPLSELSPLMLKWK